MTIQEALQQSNLRLNKYGMCRCGKAVAAAYGNNTFFKNENAPVFYKKKEGAFMVNNYPDSFDERLLKLVERYVRRHPRYQKKKRKRFINKDKRLAFMAVRKPFRGNASTSI